MSNESFDNDGLSPFEEEMQRIREARGPLQPLSEEDRRLMLLEMMWGLSWTPDDLLHPDNDTTDQ